MKYILSKEKYENLIKNRKSYQLIVQFQYHNETLRNHVKINYNQELFPKLTKMVSGTDKIIIDKETNKTKQGEKYPLYLLDAITASFKNEEDMFHNFYPETMNKLKDYNLEFFLSRRGKSNDINSTLYESKPIFNDLELKEIALATKANGTIDRQHPITKNALEDIVSNFEGDFYNYVKTNRANYPYSKGSRVNDKLMEDITNYRQTINKLKNTSSIYEQYELLEQKYKMKNIVRTRLSEYKPFREMYLLYKEYVAMKKKANEENKSPVLVGGEGFLIPTYETIKESKNPKK